MAKTTKGFDNLVTWIAITFFAVIALSSFTPVDLNPWMLTIIMIMAGASLIAEGQIRTIATWTKDGIQKQEYAFLISILLGLITIVVGILKAPILHLNILQIDGVVGIVALMAGTLIALQKWVFD